MNKIIRNGHTYTESEDVEGEYILLVDNEKPTPLEICKWVDIEISKLNNMTKHDLVDKYYGGYWNISPAYQTMHIMKTRIFKKMIKAKYNVNCDNCIDTFLSLNKKSPFTRRKCKSDSRGGVIYDLSRYLLVNSELENLL